VTAAPPLRPTGLVLVRDGSFRHEGVPVTHRRLLAALQRGVAFDAAEGAFVVRLGRFRGKIDVEDTPFFATAYDAARCEVELSDRSAEALRAETLRFDSDGVLRCTLVSGFEARFTRTAQAQLLDCVEPRGAYYALRAGDRWLALPGLPVPD
jgi:hypothetical protein